MSTPGDLGALRGALFLELAHPHQPLTLPPDHPQRSWLEWMGVVCGDGFAAPWDSLGEFSFAAEDARRAGVLPEVLYSGLVQTWWHPDQSDFVARTRSEILACFRADQLDQPGWPLTLETLGRLSRYRLGELTPAELLDASQEFWSAPADPADRAAMEGWVLLHLETFSRLQDVADCLEPFVRARGLGRGEQRAQLLLDSPEGGWDDELRDWLRLPEGLDPGSALEVLGRERVRRAIL